MENKKREFVIPFFKNSIILTEPELKGHYVEKENGVYGGYSILYAKMVTPFLMESLLKRVYWSVKHLQDFYSIHQMGNTKDLIHQVSLLIYARFKNHDISKEETTGYSQELLEYTKTFNSVAKRDSMKGLVIYHPTFTWPESNQWFDDQLSIYDECHTAPDAEEEVDPIPISVILKRESSLTDKLMVIFNYHYDQILREIKTECFESTAPEGYKKRVWEVMVQYIQDDMQFPDSKTPQDFIECMEWSQRGQYEDIPEQG